MDYERKLERLRVEALREAADEEERARRELARTESHASARGRSGAHPLLLVVSTAGLAVLPFVLLVRTAVSLHRGGAGSWWISVAGGLAVTVLLATAYAAWFSRHVTGRARVLLMLKWVALPLVCAYCGYALLYLSSANAKSETVRGEFRTVHPVLRLALSTLILVDRSLVVTDMSRDVDEYPYMGLSRRERTLHKPQPDGWVHAVDLRSIGRSRTRTALTRWYFHVMGLHTLRHVGTADHLHVSLPAPERTTTRRLLQR